MKTFRNTKKTFRAGYWSKRPKSIVRPPPGFAPSIDPSVELPGVRRNGTTAPATGNRPDTVHTRCGGAASSNADNHPPQRAITRSVRTRKGYSRPQGETRSLPVPAGEPKEEEPVGTFGMQRRKIVGGNVRTAKAYSRPQGETRNLSSPEVPPVSFVSQLEAEHAQFRKEAQADFSVLLSKLAASEARVKELEKQLSTARNGSIAATS